MEFIVMLSQCNLNGILYLGGWRVDLKMSVSKTHADCSFLSSLSYTKCW